MKLYSGPTCSKCMLLKRIMNNKGLEFQTIEDQDVVGQKSTQLSIYELPILEVGESEYYSGSEAIQYINKEY